MALITGIVLEEIVKDVVIPWWVGSEAVAIASVAGSAVAVAVEESKGPS
jgi:hypothetical protein